MCITLPRQSQRLMHAHLDVVEHLASQLGVVPIAAK